ncbi:MAG TPA: hypothetical protein DDZ70_02185, partial [Firmicutes bacterium]|nr:hypothetical protein [Bacillota bacterium]
MIKMTQKNRPLVTQKKRPFARVTLLLMAVLCSLTTSSTVLAASPGSEAASIDPKDVLDAQIGSLDLSAMDHFITTLDSETLALFPEFDLRALAAGQGVDWGNLFSQL